jgi:hypothetical protein
MAQALASASTVVELTCRDDWDDCQKKQMCAKVAALNKAAPLQKRTLSARTKRVKASWQKKYAREWNSPNPSRVWPAFAKPKGGDSEFAHPCAKGQSNLQADHIVDTQWGGHAKGPFQWLDGSVNMSIGSQMNNSQVTYATAFKADCCP